MVSAGVPSLTPFARERCAVSRVGVGQEWSHPVGTGDHHDFMVHPASPPATPEQQPTTGR